MDEELRAQVVRSRLRSGKWSADPANTGVFPSRGEKGTLYILVEVVGEEGRRETLSRELLDLIREEYRHAPGGITNGLRQALRAANAHIFQHNQAHPQEVPTMAGATCAVVRGRDLFFAQGGGVLALCLHDDQIRFYPRPGGQERVSPIPLGLEENLRDVELSHTPLGRGDVLVLASPALRELASEGELQGALALRRAPEVISRLEGLAKGQELSFLVVGLEAGAKAEEKVAPLGRVSFEFVNRLKEKEFWQSWAMALRSRLKSLLRWAGLIAKEMLPGEGRRPLPGARPRRAASPRRRETVAPRAFPLDRRRAVIAGGVLLLFLIAFLAGFNYIQQRQAEEAAYQELLTRVEEAMDLSQQATEAAAARRLLTEAEGLLAQALAERPRDSRALALEERFRAQWDEVHRILRPPLSVALELGDTGVGPRRLVFQDGVLYLLDGGADQVYAFRWSPEARALQAPSQGVVIIEVGELQEEILDIVWVPQGGFRLDPALLVLSETRLLEYEPGSGISRVPLVSREIWQTAARSSGFFGNFYVLDPASNAIWKYFATEAGYTLEPANWLDPEEEIDITTAVDMAIDGFIWVLKADGEIYKLEQGFRRIFELDGLLEPLTQPVALYTDPDAQFLYVADTGLGSILQFDKRGNFVRQFKPGWEEEEIFGSIEAFVVIEEEGVAFVLAGGKLYIMDLRAAEAPSATPTP